MLSMDDIYKQMKELAAIPFKPFPDDFTKIVLWGLGGTLVRFGPPVTKAIIKELPSALERSGFSFPMDISERVALEHKIGAMARRAHRQGGLPTGAVLRQLNRELMARGQKPLSEKLVLGEVLSQVFSQHVAVDFTSFTGSDRFDIKAFERAQKSGVVHTLLTSGSTKWAEQWLSQLGLRPFFARAVGTDIVHSRDNHVRHKRSEASQVIPVFFAQYPRDTLADVVAVDHDLRFLRIMQEAGAETVLLDRSLPSREAAGYQTAVNDLLAKAAAIGFVPDRVAASVSDVFDTALIGRKAGDFAPARPPTRRFIAA